MSEKKIHYMVRNKLRALQFLLWESDITHTNMVLSFKNVIQLYEKSELELARIFFNPLKTFFFFFWKCCSVKIILPSKSTLTEIQQLSRNLGIIFTRYFAELHAVTVIVAITVIMLGSKSIDKWKYAISSPGSLMQSFSLMLLASATKLREQSRTLVLTAIGQQKN